MEKTVVGGAGEGPFGMVWLLAPGLETLQTEFCEGRSEGGRVTAVVLFCVSCDAIDEHSGKVVEKNHEGHVYENERTMKVRLVGAAAIKGSRGVGGEVDEKKLGKVALEELGVVGELEGAVGGAEGAIGAGVDRPGCSVEAERTIVSGRVGVTEELKDVGINRGAAGEGETVSGPECAHYLLGKNLGAAGVGLSEEALEDGDELD